MLQWILLLRKRSALKSKKNENGNKNECGVSATLGLGWLYVMVV